MAMLKKIDKKWFGFGMVILATLVVYRITLATTMYWIDSAIYLATIKQFGIAYPPGFPLYIIIAKLWSFLPLPGMDFTQKINFLSSVFASLACGFLYLSILRLFANNFTLFQKSPEKPAAAPTPNIHIIIASLVALIFGLSYNFWYAATYSEVYSMHFFLMAVLFYLLIALCDYGPPQYILNEKQKKLLYGIAITYGMSFANHPMTINLIPVILWFVWKFRIPLFGNKKLFCGLLLAFFLSGFLPYIYIPIRSAQNPDIDWGNPENLTNFINHITAKHWTGEKNNFAFLNKTFFLNIWDWMKLTYYQFYGAGAIFLILGALWLWRKKKNILAPFLWIITSSVFWGTVYITTEYQTWLVPAYFIGAIFMAAAFYLLINEFRDKEAGSFIKIPAIIILLSVAAINLSTNWLTMNRRGNYFPPEVGHNILKNAEDGSIVISEAGMAMSSIIYSQYVLDYKPNIISIHRNSFWAPWMRENLKKYQKERGLFLPDLTISENDLKDARKKTEFNTRYLEEFIRGNIDKFNIYTVMPDNFKDISIIPWGVGYKYSAKTIGSPLQNWNFDFASSKFCRLRIPDFKNYSLESCFTSGMNEGAGYVQPLDIEWASNKEFNEAKAAYVASYKNLADIYFAEQDFPKAIIYYDRATNLLTDNFTNAQKFTLYFQRGLSLFYDKKFREAIDYAYYIDGLFPKQPETAWLLGGAFNKLGKKNEASNILLEAIRMYPDDENLNSLFNSIIMKQK